jgi:hypothetical protein
VGQILKKRSKQVLAPPESLRLLQRRQVPKVEHLPKVEQDNNNSN